MGLKEVGWILIKFPFNLIVVAHEKEFHWSKNIDLSFRKQEELFSWLVSPKKTRISLGKELNLCRCNDLLNSSNFAKQILIRSQWLCGLEIKLPIEIFRKVQTIVPIL